MFIKIKIKIKMITNHSCFIYQLRFIIMECTSKTTTFRHNFSESIMKSLYGFAKMHQYDARNDYKDAWKDWTENNEVVIQEEKARLKGNGFTGDFQDKMYKSGRYYFRNKKDFGERKKESVVRKQYIALDNDLIEIMDNHIMRYGYGQGQGQVQGQGQIHWDALKPAICFEEFCIRHEEVINEEEKRLFEEYGVAQEAYSKKIKKTYKNRYFQHKKHL